MIESCLRWFGPSWCYLIHVVEPPWEKALLLVVVVFAAIAYLLNWLDEFLDTNIVIQNMAHRVLHFALLQLHVILAEAISQQQKFIASIQATMGIIRSCFSFIAGTVCGVYLAQSYQIPNIVKLADTALFMAKIVEEKYRKPKKKDDNDD